MALYTPRVLADFSSFKDVTNMFLNPLLIEYAFYWIIIGII